MTIRTKNIISNNLTCSHNGTKSTKMLKITNGLNVLADLPMLTVLDQISMSYGCYRKPNGFLAFLAIKDPHYLAYHLEYRRPVFIYRDSPYLNKHSKTPKNSGNTVIIREIIGLFSESNFYLHKFNFDGVTQILS